MRKHQGKVRSGGISKNGQTVMSRSDNHIVRVWDVDQEGWKNSGLRGCQCWVRSVEMSKDGRRTVSEFADYIVRTWNLNSKAILKYKSAQTAVMGEERRDRRRRMKHRFRI